MFGSACNQPAHAFDPNVIVTPLWSLDEEKIDVMATIAFLADVQRNITLTITAGQNVDTYVGIYFSNLGMSFTGMGKLRPERLRVFW